MDMIGFYATTAATANAIAQIQIPRAGRLRGIDWNLNADLDADGEACIYELSFLPVYQSDTNNTRNLICNIGISLTGAVGPAAGAVGRFVPLDIAVSPLQILYFNAVLTGTASAAVRGVIHFQ